MLRPSYAVGTAAGAGGPADALYGILGCGKRKGYPSTAAAGCQQARAKADGDRRGWDGGHLMSLAFSPDGKWIASASYLHFRLWDATTGQARSARTEHTRPVTTLAFSPDGKWLASAGRDGQLILWDGASGDK